MNLNVSERPQLDPYQMMAEGAFVLCENIYVVGMPLRFGDKLPDYVDLHHLHVHYANGVVGTKAELESLVAPIELAKGQEDPLNPVARFTVDVGTVAAPLHAAEERGVFAIENAELLKTKDQIVEYAKSFDIKIEKSSKVPIKGLLKELETAAKAKGLI